MRLRQARAAVVATLIGMGTGGCAAAGLAAAPVMAAVQAVADRTVERTVLADLTTAAIATEAVLQRASIAVTGRETTDGQVILRATGEKVSVTATLERVTPSLTKVSVRTESGGFLADRQTSERLQQQLGSALDEDAAQRPRANDVHYVDALAALELEVRRLREQMSAGEAQPRAAAERPASTAMHAVPAAPPGLPAASPAPAFTVDTRGVVSVPASYGFATGEAPQSPGGPIHADRGAVQERAVESARPDSGTAAAALLPVPAIRPVGVVVDIRGRD